MPTPNAPAATAKTSARSARVRPSSASSGCRNTLNAYSEPIGALSAVEAASTRHGLASTPFTVGWATSALRSELPDHLEQLARAVGLRQVRGGARLPRLLLVAGQRERGDDDDRNGRGHRVDVK